MRILLQPLALATGLGWLASLAVAAEMATSDKALPPAPPLPALKAIRLEPASITLEDARDARRVLVIGERTDGGHIDLTGDARWTTASETLRIGTNGRSGPGTLRRLLRLDQADLRWVLGIASPLHRRLDGNGCQGRQRLGGR